MSEYVAIFMTAGSEEEAQKVARTLVEKRLVACCQLLPGMRSFYWWKGEICADDEVLLIAKTRRNLFDAVVEAVRSIHSYEVPEIVAMPIADGFDAYVRWLDENVTSST